MMPVNVKRAGNDLVMKQQFVGNLQEGDVVNDNFVAVRKDLREQQRGGKFLGMVFKDKTGEIGGILWNNAESIARLFEPGDVVNVQGNVATYQERLQIRVEQVLPLRDSDFDPADYVFTPADADEVWTSFCTLMSNIQNEHLRRLVDSFIADEEFAERFRRGAAGKKWHHAYRGGLLKHCLEMGELINGVCAVYTDLDRDLMLAAALLHDVGKLDELTDDLFIEYTTTGKLLGHLNLGAMLVDKAIQNIPEFPEETRLHLLHCILSHHGTLENGSPVMPKTPEAYAFHQIDNLGAQMDAILRIVEETKDKRGKWSDYVPLLDRQLWTKEL
jgi:3'-5' exoribonuclease